jgi:DNA invertase Pin-like site-specific DNA recombinase
VAKNPDGILRVIAPARISRPTQDVESMSSMHFDDEQFLRANFAGPIEMTRLSEQASGWLVDRETMLEVEHHLDSGQLDLVIVSELREVYRNPGLQWRFMFRCVDAGVRFISSFDGIDTAADNWETMAHAASLRHGMTVPETRKRVRRKAAYSFSQGGMVLKVRYGYRKLSKEEAASGQFGTPGLRMAKVPECAPVIQEMCRRILEGASPDAVAEWLNGQGIPVGSYVRGPWTGKLVLHLMKDPILSGRRRFRVVLYQQVYATGKHRRVQNPNSSPMTGVQEKEWPELAHITVAEHDAVQAVLRRRKKGAANPSGPDHPLWNRPLSRVLWPQQHARCGVCGGLMYANGSSLKCQNTLSHSAKSCWNHVQVPIALTRQRVLAWVLSVAQDHPTWREALLDAAWKEYQVHVHRVGQKNGAMRRCIEAKTKEIANVNRAIRLGEREIPSLVAELAKLDQELQAHQDELARLERATGEVVWMNRDQMAAQLPAAIYRLAETSFEFANLLRKLLPVFEIRPVQALNRPAIRPRAHLTLCWSAFGNGPHDASIGSTTIDLFDRPLHMRYVRECSELSASGWNVERIASAVGIPTNAVYRNLAYGRLMQQHGVRDDHRELTEPPTEASRWKRRQKSA